MDFNLDPFDDILSEPATCNARAGAKFRPKANPQSRKEKHATTPANLTNAANNVPATSNTIGQDSLHTFSHRQIPDLMSSTTTVADPLPTLPQSQEMCNNNEGFPSGDDNKSAAPMEFLFQHFTGKELVDSKSALHSELTISNTHGDLQPDFARLGGETADIFCSLDDIFHESTTTNVSKMRKFQPRVKANAQAESEPTFSHVVATRGEGSTSHDKAPKFHGSNDVDMEGGPGHSSLLSGTTLIPFNFGSVDTSLEFVPEEAVNNRETEAFDYEELLINAEGLEREEHTFHESVPSEVECLDDDMHPASTGCDYVHVSDAPLSAMTDCPPEFLLNENSIHHANTLSPNDSTPELVDSKSVPISSSKESSRSRKRAMKNHSRNVEEVSQETLDERSIAADEGNVSGKLTRRSRTKSSAPADNISGETEEHVSPLAEPSKYSLVDEDVYSVDDNEYGEDASRPKNSGKSKSAVQNKKAGRKRKSSSEGPDSSNDKTPKKKFSHSTRRNKRQLNKILLETPEEEIDPRKLPLKDLILLGELREQKWKKDAATLKNSEADQSVNNTFSEDAPYDPDDPFAFVQGPNPDNSEGAPPKLNYHTYMKKRPKKRWSKQDTELFYEAIRQFGTDFTMIEQLFPDLDSDPIRRRQLVKLKYKNEERRHPTQLHDALTSRSKNHSHFELVIEKLRQAEQHSDGDVESVGVSGEGDDNNSEINEVAESDPKEEVPKDMETADDPEMHSPVRSVHVTEEDAYKWSGGESDYDDYVGY